MIHFENDDEAQQGARRALDSLLDAVEALANGEADGAHWSPSHKAVVDGVDLLLRELTDQHRATFVLLAISDGRKVSNIVDDEDHGGLRPS